MSSPLAATSSAPGVVDLYMRGADNSLTTRRLANGVWTAWSSLGWVVTSPVATVPTANGGVDLYARGLDGALWALPVPAASPPSPSNLGGIIK